MAKRVLAIFGDEKVEATMLNSNREIIIYEYIDKKNTSSMRVIAHIPKQIYSINEDTGLIELEQNKKETLDKRVLKIKPILFDEITNGKWDENKVG